MSGEADVIVAVYLLATAGGAWGAHRSKSQAWRGAAVVSLATITSLAIVVAMDLHNQIVITAMQIAFAFLYGGAFGLRSGQIGYTLLGAFLAVFLIGGVASLFMAT